jgi:predicted DCC family thiol-disulfide oxidoreductase YuxK
MKTLENQTLLYDEDCPLCQVYTTGFIKAGMLDENGKKPFSNLSEAEQSFIDLKRASNEIALVDTKNKTVIYGIDSLLKVIGNSFPWIAKVGNLKPVNYFLRRLYSFVSNNRKVIIPNKQKHGKALKCIPDFNYKYRILYIAFATLITTWTLYHYSELTVTLPKGNFSRELILAVGQIAFQGLFVFQLSKKIILNYIGNLMTVSLMGSLILLPVLVLNQCINLHETAILSWFGITVFIMLLEHFRRIKILELPFYLSFTWIIYRVIALLIILNL